MTNGPLCLDAKASSENCSQLKKKMGSSALEHAVKVRKPYTISKQRERWTDEEHNKFLEALKLYGRAWRQIEEHVGTKTAVQIRSHAQKFFTKVVRESSGDSTGETKAIEIPPPRPKRKPMHAYPRKLGNSPIVGEKRDCSVMPKLLVTEQDNPLEAKLSLNEQDNLSPTSVLSAVGSDTCGSSENGCASPDSTALGSDPVGTSLSEQENGCQSATTSVENEDGSWMPHNSDMELDLGSYDNVYGKELSLAEAPTASLKLFGKTMVITDLQMSLCSTTGNAEQCPDSSSAPINLESHCKNDDMQVRVHNQNAVDATHNLPFGVHESQLNSWPGGVSPMFYLLPSHGSLHKAGAVPFPWMWAFYGGATATTGASLSLNLEQEQLASSREPLNEGGSIQQEIPHADCSTVYTSSVELRSGGRSTNAGSAQHCSLKLRRSATSAFRSLKATENKPAKGFVPYKRCVPEKKVDNQGVMMANDNGEGSGMRLCL